MTALEIVKDEASKLGKQLDDDSAGYLLWNNTGFPSFWRIPEDGNTVEECIRKQVREALA
jgi:hypothetical protein